MDCEDTQSFQNLLQLGDTAADSECLIEGGKKDRISHFILRLACSNDREMASFFIKSETHLFCLRFASMTFGELVSLLKSTYRFVHHLLHKNHRSTRHQDDIINSAVDLHLVLSSATLGNKRSWKQLVEQFMNDDYKETINVPFQYVLTLVKHREVILNHGMALVPCSKLHQILASIFREIVIDGLKRARQILKTVCDDERMVDLFRELRHAYYVGRRVGTTAHWDLEPLRCNDIDYLKQGFPPCMQNLHRSLRLKHRLRHFSRIQHTLFLKEIGLPVHEAIRFWQREYSRPPNHDRNRTHSGGCDHSWSKESKRYTYNIRHLYGLEGSRTNYKAHSCYAIQNSAMGHGEDGGCPFTHFDEKHLTMQLRLANIPSEFQTSILKFVLDKKYQSACEAYFKGRLQPMWEKYKIGPLEAHQCRKREECICRSDNQSDERDDSEFCKKMLPEQTNLLVCKVNDEIEIKRAKREFVSRTVQNSKLTPADEIQSCDCNLEKTANVSIRTSQGALQDTCRSVIEKEPANEGMDSSKRLSKVDDLAARVSACDMVPSKHQSSMDVLVEDEQHKCEDEGGDDDLGSYEVDVEKPSDYYFSYMQLLRALQSIK